MKGATSFIAYGRKHSRHFNPRTREGCDDCTAGALLDSFGISINAPVKGATDVDVVKLYVPADFNPRTREGCDVAEQLQTNLSDTFQSTHP